LEKSREILRSIGGRTVILKTEDDVLIESMFFDVNAFFNRVVDLGGCFQIDSRGRQVLISATEQCSCLLSALNMDNEQFFGFRIASDRSGAMTASTCPEGSMIPSIRYKQLTILTQGNAGLFEMSRKEVLKTLMRGNSCMVFNIRGTGRSQGTPNEEGTYRDLEAVYQYVSNRGFCNNQITVKGYCLGSGPAVHLASKHPIHLILDRPFAKISNVMSDIVSNSIIKRTNLDADSYKISFIKNCFDSTISTLIDWTVISYCNASKLKSVRGSICLIESDIDQVIPEKSRRQIRERLTSKPQAMCRISPDIGHCDEWDRRSELFFISYMQKNQMLRNFPITEMNHGLAYSIINGALKAGVRSLGASGNSAKSLSKRC
jgi:alpha/beta superfamily hydrolase